jgi:hypothetical protein
MLACFGEIPNFDLEPTIIEAPANIVREICPVVEVRVQIEGYEQLIWPVNYQKRVREAEKIDIFDFPSC